MSLLSSWVERLLGKARSSKPAPRPTGPPAPRRSPGRPHRPARLPLRAGRHRGQRLGGLRRDLRSRQRVRRRHPHPGGNPAAAPGSLPSPDSGPNQVGSRPRISLLGPAVANKPFTIEIVIRSANGQVDAGYRGTLEFRPARLGAARLIHLHGRQRRASHLPCQVAGPGSFTLRSLTRPSPPSAPSAEITVFPSGTAALPSTGPSPTTTPALPPQLVVQTQVAQIRGAAGGHLHRPGLRLRRQRRHHLCRLHPLRLLRPWRRFLHHRRGRRAQGGEGATPFSPEDDGARTFRVVFKARGRQSIRVADPDGKFQTGTFELSVR